MIDRGDNSDPISDFGAEVAAKALVPTFSCFIQQTTCTGTSKGSGRKGISRDKRGEVRCEAKFGDYVPKGRIRKVSKGGEGEKQKRPTQPMRIGREIDFAGLRLYLQLPPKSRRAAADYAQQ